MDDFARAYNNAGIESMTRGDLGTSLELLSITCSPELQQHLVKEIKVADVTSCVWGLRWEDCSKASDVSSFRRNTQKPEMDPFVYQCALKLVPATNADVSDGCYNNGVPTSSSLCGAGGETSQKDASTWVFVYNFALASHLLGMRLGEKGMDFMAQALLLYETAETLLLIESPRERPLVTMAIHNNQACIYHQIGLYSEAEYCLARLAIDLLLTKDSDTGLADWNGFFLNVSILRRTLHTAAAA